MRLPILLSIPFFSLAAADPQPFELGEVVITADTISGAEAMTTRVTASDIRKFERTDLSEALRLSPGVFGSNNGPRNESGVYVRGFDLRQTPVFIDGIPVYVPYDGYVDLRRFSSADVAEISISKG